MADAAAPEDKDLDIDSTVDSLVGDLGLGDPAGDAKGSPTPSPLAKPDAGSTPTTQPGGATQPVAPVIPQSVPKELHEIWGKTDKQLQDWYGKREKEFLDGTQGYRTQAEYAKTLDAAISPYRAHIQARGVDDVRAVKFLLNADYVLTNGSPEKKVEFFAMLAKDYGIDLAKLPSEQPYTDPALKSMHDRFAAMEGRFAQFTQAQFAQQRETVAKQVDAFASDPKHLYFDELGDDISKLINAGYGLEDAYDKAVWANPATRAKEQARLDKERQAANEDAARKAAETARKARGSSVRGKQPERAPTAPLGSIDETLKETLESIHSRS